MPGLASIRTNDASTSDLHLLAAGQNRTSTVDNLRRSDQAADTITNVSMDDLLDHTWHYQCVVSPAFSAALKHNNIIPATSDPQNKSASPHTNISPPAAAAAANPHVDDLLRKPNLKVNGALICNTSNSSAPSSHLEQDAGYVSLASLIINVRSPSSTDSTSSSCVSSPTSVHRQGPHHHHHHYSMGLSFDHLFNFLRKQNKSRSTTTFTSSTTCRDSARRSTTSHCSAATESSHMINGLNYASYLTVD